MDTTTTLFLMTAVGIALAFEFVNGFHDTANAVATVIYTRSLPPRAAVLWSGLWNFLGVQLGGIAVAFAIINLLPVELVAGSLGYESRAMVLALLFSAISWNLYTWWRGLPASSSHALIGSILGVGIANAYRRGLPLSDGVNWHKVTEVGISLLFSPMLGFVAAALILIAARFLFRNPVLHTPVDATSTPPPAVRATLIATCTGVSFAHGSNDGQKGVGLVMLVLIGILPARFALDPNIDRAKLERAVVASRTVEQVVSEVPPAQRLARAFPDMQQMMGAMAIVQQPPRIAGSFPDGQDALPLVRACGSRLRGLLAGKDGVNGIPEGDRAAVRQTILVMSAAVAQLDKNPQLELSPAERARMKAADRDLRTVTDYAPSWVLLAVSLALGLGTTVGWKRIVVTVGEKIGKSHMTYAQGASAELVAMGAIGAAGAIGMPVSTTHVLAAGIAGTMAAQRSGLQHETLTKILMAWVLTLPVCIGLSTALFSIFCWVLK
jgi:phosphate/sulfate permease